MLQCLQMTSRFRMAEVCDILGGKSEDFIGVVWDVKLREDVADLFSRASRVAQGDGEVGLICVEEPFYVFRSDLLAS